MTTFIGCSYYESDSTDYTCPNCDEDLVVARSVDLIWSIDEETETAYLSCPICTAVDIAIACEPNYVKCDRK